MKVSIITVCYNSENTIRDTINSVLQQTYPDIEYIIIDGNSDDGTAEIISEFKDRISTFISEPDKGMYDALNKGLDMASGEVVGILNADDVYCDDMVIKKVIDEFEKGVDGVYGDLYYVDQKDTGKVVRYWKSGKYSHGMFKKGWMPPHPTFFVRRDVYLKYGGFNTTLKSAADYELMLRFIHKQRIKLGYVPEVLVKMRMGGKSNRSLTNRVRANQEDRLAWKLNDLDPGNFTMFLKPLRKIPQFFRKK